MKSVGNLMEKLRGEMSTRIDDRDIVEILEVLEEASDRIDDLEFSLRTCKYHAENIIEAEYGETMDAHDVVEEVNDVLCQE